jgi:cold shock CspA family protein
MKTGFEISELNNFGTGVRLFFSDSSLPENSKISEFRRIKDHIYSHERLIAKLQRNPSLSLYYVATGNEPENNHFTAIREVVAEDLAKNTECFFDSVEISIFGGRRLIKACQELSNSFDVQLDIKDIFPLSVDPKTEVKKAYAFTCSALEFLKILTKEEGSIRRSLFNDNVRDYLGNQGAINQEIEETVATNPEMFLLCNNGVTIVCSGFDQIRDKLVRIENPQIVNGCQTSNTLFELRKHPNISKLQLLVRVICTDNHDVSNRVVRGTNRQNQVLEEAFEATLPFHKETLEPYFAAFETKNKILYERRARQYVNDPLVKKTQIINLRNLTQAFVGMFLDAPHESHRHEAKLLENYAGEEVARRIFREDHGPEPYFVCGLTWSMFERYLHDEVIHPRYRTYKAHLYLAFRHSVDDAIPKLTRSRALEAYCKKIMTLLEEPKFSLHAKQAIDVFESAYKAWIERGGSPYGIKDNKDFTDLLVTHAKKQFSRSESPNVQEDDKTASEGVILRVLWRNGVWYGFIKRGSAYENVYFDSRAYRGEPRELLPARRVKFDVVSGDRGLYAKNLVFLS